MDKKELPQQKQQHDFFSSMMFGSNRVPPQQSEQEKTSEEEPAKQGKQSEPAESNPQNTDTNKSLEDLIILAQQLGPYVKKIAPLLARFQNKQSSNKK